MAKQKRPTWFKMFLHHKALIDVVSDEVAGKALKACYAYFDNGEVRDMDSMAFAVFASIKPNIDESWADYEKQVKDGKDGADKRWHNSPPMPP